ncbi:MAG: TfoX/Sxy family protein [Bacteroidia bacterium]|nr:TfoX/Sxy family protein [Bacteroidia bacterium]
MPYDELLADRVNQTLKAKKIRFAEKKMFGGMCYMVDDKMCVGVSNEDLMARINPDVYDKALKKKGAREMDFTGRPMKGYIFVGPNGIDKDKDLDYWVQLALDFNPLAKSSKKKK